MNWRELFRFQLTTMGVVMIPVAVGINFIGKQLANMLNLPMWLDSVGTILSAIVAGPWIGAISGAVNNVFFGLTMDGGISILYGITSVAIAFVAGTLARLGWFKSFTKALLAGVVIAVVAAIVSTPINVGLWGGETGKVWADAFFAFLMAKDLGIWPSSFIAEIAMDLVDKVVVTIIVYFIALGLPKRFVQSMQSSNKTVRQ